MKIEPNTPCAIDLNLVGVGCLDWSMGVRCTRCGDGLKVGDMHGRLCTAVSMLADDVCPIDGAPYWHCEFDDPLCGCGTWDAVWQTILRPLPLPPMPWAELELEEGAA